MSKYWENGFYLEQNKTITRKEISEERWKELLEGQNNGKEIFTNAEGFPDLRDYVATAEEIKLNRMNFIKGRLISLSEDIIQDQVGEIVEDFISKKLEFIDLHNELRTLLGKPVRNIK